MSEGSSEQHPHQQKNHGGDHQASANDSAPIFTDTAPDPDTQTSCSNGGNGGSISVGTDVKAEVSISV